MKIVLFGATGMVGQGVLRECLLDREVEQVLSAARSSTGQLDPKLRECVVPNLLDLTNVEQELTGYDACMFCMGASAAGLSEADYRRINYDVPRSVAGRCSSRTQRSRFNTYRALAPTAASAAA
jgi:nucleoside-diphosphate-sugar epimerase